MSCSLESTLERDRAVWDSCARIYEKLTVTGHPDVMANEAFEEDLIDRVLIYLIKELNRNIGLHDIGCGSGRLHVRYGLKTVRPGMAPRYNEYLVRRTRDSNPGYAFDQDIADGLQLVRGLDFSAAMIALAIEKLARAGLSGFLEKFLFLEQGSAFDLPPFPSQPLPLVIALGNSIGSMQGPRGAAELFKAMRRAVEESGGIALISAYRREAVESFALGNYESVMSISGVPRWLTPDFRSDRGLRLTPKFCKRAYDSTDQIIADVFDRTGTLVQKDLVFRRAPAAVEYAILTGHIQTFTNYESYWYSWDQMQAWIDDLWPHGFTYHLEGKKVDRLRASPIQIAVLDRANLLQGFMRRWFS